MRAIMALLVVAAGLAGCTDDGNGTEDPGDGGQGPGDGERSTAILCTNFGPIEFTFFDERAPNTTQNFIDLAQADYYDGVTFHRIITGFMMQGGDPTGTGGGGEAAGGGTIEDEFHPELRHDRPGMVSMANRGPNTGSSQFFITFTATPHLDDAHAIFAEVTDGMDVVEAVETQAASTSGTPRTPVVMEDVLVGGEASDCENQAPPAAPPEPEPVEECDGLTGTTVEGPMEMDVVTPVGWCIHQPTDHILFWVHNPTDEMVTGSWEVLEAPEGLDITLSDTDATLSANGTKNTTGFRPTYPDWSHTLASATSDGMEPGVYTLRISYADTTLTVPVQVVGPAQVADIGSQVTVEYTGTFLESGEQFDEGSFSVTLGEGRTVAGFEFGLLGLGHQEDARLVLPAALHYGYDNPEGPYERFNGKTIVFEVRTV